MAVSKRKAPARVSNASLLSVALQDSNELNSYLRRESERYENERIEFLLDIGKQLGIRREGYGSDMVWLYELAYRLAHERYASAGVKGKSLQRPSVEDFQLWAEWNSKKRTSSVSDRKISIELVERVAPWKGKFEAALLAQSSRRPEDRMPRREIRRRIADLMRKRYALIAPRIEKIMGK
jgi:hypothetical protein